MGGARGHWCRAGSQGSQPGGGGVQGSSPSIAQAHPPVPQPHRPPHPTSSPPQTHPPPRCPRQTCLPPHQTPRPPPYPTAGTPPHHPPLTSARMIPGASTMPVYSPVRASLTGADRMLYAARVCRAQGVGGGGAHEGCCGSGGRAGGPTASSAGQAARYLHRPSGPAMQRAAATEGVRQAGTCPRLQPAAARQHGTEPYCEHGAVAC